MLFELENVSYLYPDGTPALDDVSFSIEAGQGVVLLGANGSGKSTLLRLLNGLYFPSSGRVLFNGKEISPVTLEDNQFRAHFRHSVGFVFQQADAQLFNSTVFEEVAFGPRQLGFSDKHSQVRALETMDFLGITHLGERAPFNLSGGEKRKVAIASVLSMNPQVLLFDEPFLGLDPRGQGWLVRTIQQLREAGKTTIIATHTLEMVSRIANRAIVLGENHRLVSMGSVYDIFSDQRLLIDANLVGESAE